MQFFSLVLLLVRTSESETLMAKTNVGFLPGSAFHILLRFTLTFNIPLVAFTKAKREEYL